MAGGAALRVPAGWGLSQPVCLLRSPGAVGERDADVPVCVGAAIGIGIQHSLGSGYRGAGSGGRDLCYCIARLVM
jgi:hypothetical protein